MSLYYPPLTPNEPRVYNSLATQLLPTFAIVLSAAVAHFQPQNDSTTPLPSLTRLRIRLHIPNTRITSIDRTSPRAHPLRRNSGVLTRPHKVADRAIEKPVPNKERHDSTPHKPLIYIEMLRHAISDLPGHQVQDELEQEAAELGRGHGGDVLSRVDGDKVANTLVPAELAGIHAEHLEGLGEGVGEREGVAASVPVLGELLVEEERGNVVVIGILVGAVGEAGVDEYALGVRDCCRGGKVLVWGQDRSCGKVLVYGLPANQIAPAKNWSLVARELS